METAIETTYTAATPLELIAELRAALSVVMRVENHTIHAAPVDLIEFTGQLTCPSEQAFSHIYKSFIALGYTPMLTQRDGKEVVVAQHGIVEATKSDPRINAVLLVATIASTVVAGTLLYAETSALGQQLLGRAGDPLQAMLIVLRTPQLWLIGLPYAAALLSILGVHEMGHYVAARRHKADVTLPYFIPMPIGLGTMGAVIRLKSPIQNRKQLFDIGVAGPLAGLAVAVPLLIIGLATSPVVFIGRSIPGGQEGNSILYLVLKLITKGQILPGGGYDVSINAIAFAGWFGLIVTMINLLPIGQLDGGHIIFSIFGREQWKIAVIAQVLLLLGGIYLVFTTGEFLNVWIIWAILAQVFGLRHPPPLDDLTPLDRKRRLIGYATIVIFFLILTPLPFS
jgi:membrane-associated protease RseP (regulator of RpoE activity)